MTDAYEDDTVYTDVDDYVAVDEHLVHSAHKSDVIKVSAKSRSTAVAGAIAAVMRESRYAERLRLRAGICKRTALRLSVCPSSKR
jgi:hypothetical protein